MFERKYWPFAAFALPHEGVEAGLQVRLPILKSQWTNLVRRGSADEGIAWFGRSQSARCWACSRAVESLGASAPVPTVPSVPPLIRIATTDGQGPYPAKR